MKFMKAVKDSQYMSASHPYLDTFSLEAFYLFYKLSFGTDLFLLLIMIRNASTVLPLGCVVFPAMLLDALVPTIGLV